MGITTGLSLKLKIQNFFLNQRNNLAFIWQKVEYKKQSLSFEFIPLKSRFAGNHNSAKKVILSL
jgi:hypothetical protein